MGMRPYHKQHIRGLMSSLVSILGIPSPPHDHHYLDHLTDIY